MTSKRYGYARVSSEDQSLDVQIAALNAVHCDVVLSEKASGASREGRARLALLLQVISAGDMVIVTKLDRLARDTVDMLEIVREIAKKGAGFKSLDESWANVEPADKSGAVPPITELALSILGGVAQFERARIRQRQAEGIAAAKAKGTYKGGKQRFAPSKIRAMHADGMRPVDISRALDCSERTVFKALAET